MKTQTNAIAGAALIGAMLASSITAAAPSSAVDYTLDSPRSALKFQFKQAGANNQGRFRKFSMNLRFSDTRLNASKLDMTIDVSSLDTGDEERDNVLRGPELFDVARFPRALFKATKISRVSAGRYEAVGKLTIRDVTREVRVPFTFRMAAEKSVSAAYIGRRGP